MAGEARSALEGAILIVELLRRIPRRGFTTSRHLHEQVKAASFDVSLRTVQRHLDAICGCFPIECDTRSKPYGYRWLAGNQGLHLPLLTPAEALLLRLAKREISELLPARTLVSLAPLFDASQRELEAITPHQADRRWLDKVLRIPDSQPLLAPRIAPEVFEAVSEALYHERKLHIHYRNARGKRKQATVWPLGVVQQGVRLYLVCRFEGYDNERILALPRLVQAQASNEAFPWPKGFDLKRYCLEGHFGISRGRQVRLRFVIDKACGQHLVESPLATDQRVEDLGERLQIESTVVETELLHRWLRSWGDQVTDVVLEPTGSLPAPTG